MSERPFDPSKHLSKVGGNDYLEVKWRLAWLRDLHPDATIETELVNFVSPLPHPETGEIAGLAVVRVVASIPNGGSATGYAHETSMDFRDFLEKAETKAIGRALAALGFGTQFAGEFTEAGATAGTGRKEPKSKGTANTDDWSGFWNWLKDTGISPQEYANIVGKTANLFENSKAAYHALVLKRPELGVPKSTQSAAGK